MHLCQGVFLLSLIGYYERIPLLKCDYAAVIPLLLYLACARVSTIHNVLSLPKGKVSDRNVERVLPVFSPLYLHACVFGYIGLH